MSEPGVQRIVVLDDYQGVALEHADWGRIPAGWEVVPVGEHLEGEALEAALAGAPIVVAMRERTAFPAALLDRLPDLRLLVTTGMANASIDVAAARRNGVVVCGTRSVAPATLEHTWALLLALVRAVPYEDAGMRAGAWQRTVGTELSGRTLGLVGLGRLGSAMVPVAKAFGMEVLAWSFNLDGDAAREAGAEPVMKSELFRRSEVVSVHYKLGQRSVGLVGAAELAAMKPSAYLVNTSRGPVVDSDALLAALREGRIAGAALDVYDTEPLPPTTRCGARRAPSSPPTSATSPTTPTTSSTATRSRTSSPSSPAPPSASSSELFLLFVRRTKGTARRRGRRSAGRQPARGEVAAASASTRRFHSGLSSRHSSSLRARFQ